jgi:hypothetical protein
MLQRRKLNDQTQQFDFKYDDTDTIMHELDEFYPYVEMPIVAKNKERFEGSFDGGKSCLRHLYGLV